MMRGSCSKGKKQRENAIDDLLLNTDLDKRQIANKVGVDVAMVFSRMKTLRGNGLLHEKLAKEAREEAEKNKIKKYLDNVVDPQNLNDLYTANAEDMKMEDSLILNKEKEEEVLKDVTTDIQNDQKEQNKSVVSKRLGFHIPDDVKLAIFEDLCSNKFTQNEIAEKYGVSRSTVINLIKTLDPNAELIRRKQKITEDMRVSMIKEVLNGATQADTAIKYNIAKSSVNKIMKEYREETKLYKKVHDIARSLDDTITEEAEEDIVKDMIEANKKKHIYTTLFFERHDAPEIVKLSIFSGDFSPAQFVNLEYQENIVNKFIDTHFHFTTDGIPEEDLIVYLSGCQVAFGSVMRVCNKRKINLTVMHYSPKSRNGYFAQPIFTEFNDMNNSTKEIKAISWIVEKYDHTYLYKLDQDNIPDVIFGVEAGNNCFLSENHTDSVKIMTEILTSNEDELDFDKIVIYSIYIPNQIMRPKMQTNLNK